MYEFEGLRGVHMSLKIDDEEMPIDAGGKVGWLEAGKSALLTAHTKLDSVWLLAVDGRKNIVFRRNESGYPDVRIYPTRIAIKESETSGIAHTEYPNNHFRVLRYVGNGTAEMWETALVSQNGLFWVTAQKTYDITCGRTDNQFLCPAFAKKWPQLVQLLAGILADVELPPEVAKTPTTPATNNIIGNNGIVLWWNCAQQMGAIATNRGNARVHWSKIIVANGDLRRLTAGQLVAFRDLLRPKQPEVGRKTSFRWEAVDVKPV